MKENDGRHAKLANLTGLRFGKLTVISYNYNGTWHCLCDCGNYTDKLTSDIKKGKYPNCGCEKYWWKGNSKHNHCNERIYNIYEKMKSRCYTEQCKEYNNYGKRGIIMCDEWLGENGFKHFYDWAMSNGYQDNLSIDRINVNGNYEPNNCRWANNKTQSNNKRNNHYVEYQGVAHTIAEWAEIYNMPYDRLHMRIKHGWEIEKALLTPKMNNQFTYHNTKGDN